MTATLEAATTAKDPRELLDAETFGLLAQYVAEHQDVTAVYAERMVEQLLVWLQAAAENPTVRLAMDETVDPAWHAFLLHSQQYAEFCDRTFGYYLHHVPPAPGVSHTEAEVDRTLPALYATGYRVDEEFWVGKSPCCPPNPCVKAVAVGRPECQMGGGAEPPAVSS
jgi:hypothetical protein